jgi:hypothetical protein
MNMEHVIVKIITAEGVKVDCCCRIKDSEVERNVVQEMSEKEDSCPHKGKTFTENDFEIASSTKCSPDRLRESREAVKDMTSED